MKSWILGVLVMATISGCGDASPGNDPGVQGPEGPMGPAGPEGEKGDAGAPGSPGIQGLAGEPGPMGPQGEQGQPGAPGERGQPGPEGPAGQQGIPGPNGPVGPRGATGADGAMGPTGADGAVGPEGPRGSVGETGPIGPAGPTGPAGGVRWVDKYGTFVGNGVVETSYVHHYVDGRWWRFNMAGLLDLPSRNRKYSSTDCTGAPVIDFVPPRIPYSVLPGGAFHVTTDGAEVFVDGCVRSYAKNSGECYSYPSPACGGLHVQLGGLLTDPPADFSAPLTPEVQ
jgi:hypothetical protein